MTGTTSTSRRRGLKDVQERVNFNANELFLIALLTLYFFMPLIILSLIDLQINSHFKFYIISKIQQKVFEQKLNFWAPQRFNDLCAGSAHYNFALLYYRTVQIRRLKITSIVCLPMEQAIPTAWSKDWN